MFAKNLFEQSREKRIQLKRKLPLKVGEGLENSTVSGGICSCRGVRNQQLDCVLYLNAHNLSKPNTGTMHSPGVKYSVMTHVSSQKGI